MQALARLCIRRPVFATMLVLGLVVLGLDAYFKLGVDLFPKVEFPIVSVTTTLRGASPEEVETQVTKRIEEAVNTISGIDEIFSNSSEGRSLVSVRFVLEKDPDVGAQEVRDKIAGVLAQLPRDADPPVIEKLATDASPVMNVVVSSARDLRETTKLTEDVLKKNLESLTGVGEVRFVGDRRRQIQVWLDGERLYGYGLNIDQIRLALAAQNVEVPGGRLDQGNRELALRTLGRLEQPADFAKVIVANVNGSPVRIRDIGRVEDGMEEPRSMARLNSKEAVVLTIRKQAGTNTLQVIQTVKTRIEELRPSLPPDFQIAYVADQSRFIQESFRAVQEHLVLGGVLAAIVVLLFIRSWRSTLIAAVAIPTSIISTYTLMNAKGFTLNQISMLALTLMVGIVIDDAIVVLENIFRFMEEKKLAPAEAAMRGTADIGPAVMATTFSLAVVFLPVALMTGIIGRFMSSFGFTAAFSVMVSLLVSFTLTPMLCSRFLKLDAGGGAGTKDTALFRAVSRPYRVMLHWSISHRWVIVVAAALTVAATAPIFMNMGIDFLPQDDQSEFEVVVRMPPGSSLQGTGAMLTQLEAELKQLPGVKNLLTLAGADIRRQVDRGSIVVSLVPMAERKETQKELMVMARERLRKHRDLVIGVQLPSMIQGSGPNVDFQYNIKGPDLARLDEYTQAIRKRLSEVPGVTDLDSSYESGKPEVRVRINRDKAADLGVSVASIATALRTLVAGDSQVTTYREGDDRYDVQLRVEKSFRESPGALNRLFVPSATLGNVAVANVAGFEDAVGPIGIDRFNRQRQINITANITGGQSLSSVLAITAEAVSNLNLPPEYTAGAVGKSKELGRAGRSYVVAFGLSIVFMYMILAAQFESFIDPVTILISLPLSIPFALLSLMLMNENFSIVYTSLGILVLFGIVKKNAILQIDHIKSLRREGVPRLEAIFRGCEDRLRPILMTTAALVAGMLPLALGGGAGSGTRRTVAIVVIGGQSLCLLLTLLVTPVAYSIFDDLAHAAVWARIGRRLNPRRAGAAISGLFALLVILAPGAPGADAPHRVGVGPVQRKLALKEAIEMALKNNLDIEIESTARASAKVALQAAKGAFDPGLRYTPSIESRTTPAASILVAPTGKLSEHYHSQNFSFRLPTTWNGFNLRVDFENQRLSTSNPFTSLTPYYNSRLIFSLAQPLLRGRATDPQRTELRIRRKQLDVSDLDFEFKSIDVVTRVEQAYWDLVAVRQDVEVEAQGVALSEEQLARTRRAIDAGTIAPVELSASVAELERRRDSHFQSLGLLTQAENNLKSLLTPDRKSEVWSEEIVPVDTQKLDTVPVWELPKLLDAALGRRVELRQLRARVDVNAIQRELARDLIKPQVNLVAAYTPGGLAGNVRSGDNPFSQLNADLYKRVNELSAIVAMPPLPPPSVGGPPPQLIGGYGGALQSALLMDYPTVQAGLSFDLTFRNRTAKANFEQTALTQRRLSLEQARAELVIETQVRNSLQGIETARQRISAAGASERAAKEKLDSEIRLFQTGESTNFLVLTRQNEYLDSRRRAVQSRLLLNNALARLAQATGYTLESHNVTIK